MKTPSFKWTWTSLCTVCLRKQSNCLIPSDIHKWCFRLGNRKNMRGNGLPEDVEPFKALNNIWNPNKKSVHKQAYCHRKNKTKTNRQRWLKWNLMSRWFGENFMQFQARCNSATSPIPSTKRRQNKKKPKSLLFVFNWMIHLKKTPCSKSVQRKYIWDLHLKVHY